jgi:hypothetical protein
VTKSAGNQKVCAKVSRPSLKRLCDRICRNLVEFDKIRRRIMAAEMFHHLFSRQPAMQADKRVGIDCDQPSERA